MSGVAGRGRGGRRDETERLLLQAAARSEVLERAAREAASSEVSLDSLQQWLDKAGRELRAGPGARPGLRAELPAARRLLRDVARQADVYRAAGKLEAAARLQDQLELQQRKFSAVEEQLEAPAEAEAEAGAGSPAESVQARLERAVAALGGVQRDCARALPLAAHEPDAVRAQLRTCLVSTYNTY